LENSWKKTPNLSDKNRKLSRHEKIYQGKHQFKQARENLPSKTSMRIFGPNLPRQTFVLGMEKISKSKFSLVNLQVTTASQAI
jgi:hypothetical protein